ncbi:hypothetical protein [Loigolactobacillus jiayinensis]|uniref:Uncharacterized protein n=1 Tax=Loigolactobacillus jiayinensis TaxID=2486016 RepID=A0ABW1RGX8_9LACO|nr:hypothetical protein [Loigolactobacillus jiayinensis]
MAQKTHRKRIYAFYRGEEYICDGTAEELAQKAGLDLATIKNYATSQHRKWLKTHGSDESISIEPIGWTERKKKAAKEQKNNLVDIRETELQKYIMNVLLPNSMDGYTGPGQIAADEIKIIESAEVFPHELIYLSPLATTIVNNEQEFRDMVTRGFEWLAANKN